MNPDGILDKNLISDEDAARLIQKGLILNDRREYRLNFACFTEEQLRA